MGVPTSYTQGSRFLPVFLHLLTAFLVLPPPPSSTCIPSLLRTFTFFLPSFVRSLPFVLPTYTPFLITLLFMFTSSLPSPAVFFSDFIYPSFLHTFHPPPSFKRNLTTKKTPPFHGTHTGDFEGWMDGREGRMDRGEEGHIIWRENVMKDLKVRERGKG